jgi:arsenate reductase
MDEALKRGPFPIWFSDPVYVHWPYPDPQVVAEGDMERRGAYRRLYGDLEQQILKLTGMNLKGLSPYALKDRLDAIAPKL